MSVTRMAANLAAVIFLYLSCGADAFIKEWYTTNAICSRKHCINPIFPGLEDLNRLSDSMWTCGSLRKSAASMNFCRAAINYEPALPVPMGADSEFSMLVRKQDNAAATMFNFHLSGMGIEFWDHLKPEFSDDDCIKSIWRMACYTYFPRAEVGCMEGQAVRYIRPCQSTCQNYVRQCGVECCDESVQCVFTHQKAITPSLTVTTQGYIPQDGPSSMCTGAARRSARSPFVGIGAALWGPLLVLQMLWASGASSGVADACGSLFRSPTAAGLRRHLAIGVLVMVAFTVQGCDMDVPSHQVGNWRAEPDYLINYEFIPPGGSASSARINSCSFERLASTLQCNGRGVCKLWDEENLGNQVAFCDCDSNWADPECRTRRKSQIVAFLWATFFGFAGADMFYLGYPLLGVFKLVTLGGFGVWWVVDVIRIGSAPVYSSSFRVAADLPHWCFVLCVVSLGLFIGFGVSYVTTLQYRRRKRKQVLLMQAEEEARSVGEAVPYSAAYESNVKPGVGPTFGTSKWQPGYGATSFAPGANEGPTPKMLGVL